MKNNLAKRLEKVLMQDKGIDPTRILPALKADIRDILRMYADLSQDITIQIQESDTGYNIIMLASATRFKA